MADVFDALTSNRPYKDAWTCDEALAEIERQRGRQFDPQLVDAFVRMRSPGALRGDRWAGALLEPSPS